MPRFDFDATGIGSVPFRDSKAACRLIYDNFHSIPFWPQLPKRSFLENMYVQYSEGMPGVVLDESDKTIHIDTGDIASSIEAAYGKYLERDLGYFMISEDRAEGLYRFLDSFKDAVGPAGRVKCVKGHVTGPVSYALSVTNQKKVPIIYDKDIFEVIAKVLEMKTRWQIKKLKSVSPEVIIFMDEPYLVSIGSSYVNIDMATVAEKIDSLAAVIKEEGGLSGIHCCGNTDWSMLLKRGVDILNFDAYNFMKEFSLYAADIEAYLKKGGTIAWGMIPSSEALDDETEASLAGKLKEAIKRLNDKGVGKDGISSIVTPSCGLGTMSETRAEKVFRLAKALDGK